MFSVKSTRFLAELQRRRDAFYGKTISAKIVVPPELAWWGYHEFGTTRFYPIDPVNAKVLSWPEPEAAGGRREAYHVNHPPIAPKAMVRMVLPSIVQHFGEAVGTAIVESNYDPIAVQDSLVNDAMPFAKQEIVQSISEQLPNTRPDGKLEGETAADVFAANAEIVEG